jgi:hypothetical protein
MRPVASFRSWYTDVRAVRVALAASAVAGLVVIAACTDSSDKNLTAPKTPAAPRLANASSGSFANAKHVDLCVDATSPAGSYTFVNSAETNDNPKNAALTGNGFRFSGVWKDGGDGGTGSTVYNDDGGGAPHVAKGATYTVVPLSGVPNDFANCVRVLDRTNANVNYDPNSGDPNNRTDSYSGITITNTGGPGIYDHTDCLLDVGVLFPEHIINPLPAIWDASHNYVAGDLVSTNVGNRVWRAKVNNTNVDPAGAQQTGGGDGTTWQTNYLGDCASNGNPTRAFANFEHGTVVTFHFTQQPIITECTLGYPDNSHLPQSQAAFNENEVLTGFQLVAASGGNPAKLHAWYSDEHALTLGVDSVFINNKNVADQGFHYNMATMAGHGNPGPTTSGVTGNPIATGRAPGATDAPIGMGNPVDGAGRPLSPGIYVTDLTANGVNSRIGDWQQGSGVAVSPNELYGTWKGATVTIDNTKNPAQTKLVPGADPAKNNKIVGTGGLNPPALAQNFGYSSDIVWNITTPTFVAGHDYRVQIIVHDGDQNKSGGDVGQACINIDQ